MNASDTMLTDAFFDSLDEALEEASRRRGLSHASADSVVSKVEKSPYGGYRVRSIPTGVYSDFVADSITDDAIRHRFG